MKQSLSLIGKNAEIKRNNQSFEGKIIDETKNTIIIKTKKGNKTIEKQNSEIKVK